MMGTRPGRVLATSIHTSPRMGSLLYGPGAGGRGTDAGVIYYSPLQPPQSSSSCRDEIFTGDSLMA